MQFVFIPERVCSKMYMIEVDEKSRIITRFDFKGGCPGNLQGIGRLIRGMHIDEVISRFENMPICPTSKVSSCPEPIRRALLDLRAKLDTGMVQEQPRFGLESFASLKK